MSVARYAPTVARVLTGLIFLVFGLNGFLHFLPNPPSMPEREAAFAGALIATGYMFPLIKATEVVAGALLLANRFVPLALTLLAPIVVNIVAFHAFLGGAPNALVIGILLLEIYLAYAYRDAFKPMLGAKVKPTTSNAEAATQAKPARAAA